MPKMKTEDYTPTSKELRCAELSRRFIEEMTQRIDRNWRGVIVKEVDSVAEGQLVGSIAVKKYEQCMSKNH